MLTRRALLASIAAASGCARSALEPLGRLYRHVGTSDDQPPLIVIPGAFGSQLRRTTTGEEIWPHSDTRLIFGSYLNIEVAIDPETLDPVAGDVEAFEIFKTGPGRDYYGRLLRTLENVGGYRRQYAGQTVDAVPRSYYVYPYDWRLDNVAAAQGLHDLIEQVAVDHGDPRLKVDILAHSNGGLLARYYARFGIADMLTDAAFEPAWNGSHRIRRLLMVGTPNLGTMQPVLSHLRGEDIGLGRLPTEIVATTSGVPQLMPHPQIPWLFDTRGEQVELDVYDIETWRELKWSIFDSHARSRVIRRHGGGSTGRAYLAMLEAYLAKHLARGRRFQEVMALPARPDEPVPFVFGGDCIPTVACLILEKFGKHFQGRDQVEHIRKPLQGVDYDALIHEPGDGVVVRSSLIGRTRTDGDRTLPGLEIAQSFFLCEEHQQLTGNLNFQDNLLFTLERLE